jgi:hypothetical protein
VLEKPDSRMVEATMPIVLSLDLLTTKRTKDTKVLGFQKYLKRTVTSGSSCHFEGEREIFP